MLHHISVCFLGLLASTPHRAPAPSEPAFVIPEPAIPSRDDLVMGFIIWPGDPAVVLAESTQANVHLDGSTDSTGVHWRGSYEVVGGGGFAAPAPVSLEFHTARHAQLSWTQGRLVGLDVEVQRDSAVMVAVAYDPIANRIAWRVRVVVPVAGSTLCEDVAPDENGFVINCVTTTSRGQRVLHRARLDDLGGIVSEDVLPAALQAALSDVEGARQPGASAVSFAHVDPYEVQVDVESRDYRVRCGRGLVHVVDREGARPNYNVQHDSKDDPRYWCDVVDERYLIVWNGGWQPTRPSSPQAFVAAFATPIHAPTVVIDLHTNRIVLGDRYNRYPPSQRVRHD